MSLAAGTRLGPYEVLSDLGRGGMGEVYKARDLKLGREVAIKVLPHEMASDSERLRRFEQEARAASAMNHPNIVHIYEIGEHEGTPYIAMEYVEGQTLREILAGGPLPNDKLIRYATQMAEGLAKAHQAGIVHRDLKPENIIVSDDGYIKILDFGLAKLLPEGEVGAELSTLAIETAPGTILGTVGYMSPEQAKGQSADFRSDQFSFGTIVYEMATGKIAFERDSATQTLNAIIEDEPELVTLVNPKVAATTARVIDRCLSKDPSERYDSTWDIAKDIHWEELATPATRHPLAAVGIVGILAIILLMFGLFVPDLREWVAGDVEAPKIESIAVLPLENLSGDPEQDYFAAGMHEALITDLAKLSGLGRVIARSSVMRYQDTDKSLAEIGRELNVEAVITGSVLRAGERVRISAQLIDAATEEHLWAERYERELRDVLALQNEVVGSIAREIQLNLTPAEETRLASARPVNPEAHDAYLKGMFHWQKFTPQDLDAALSYFELALEIDPDYALAHVGVGLVWSGRRQMLSVPAREATPIEKAAVLKALELDESLAEAHYGFARLKFLGEWDWPSAERAFERALELNPNYADARTTYSHLLNIVGRPDEAMTQIERALELDPFNALSQASYGNVPLFVRQYDDAIAAYRKALTVSPNIGFALMQLVTALHLTGGYEEALDAQKAYFSAVGDDESQEALTQGYAEGGYGEAMRRAAETFAARSLRTDTGAFYVALLYARAGKKERALEWLERGFATRDAGMPYLRVPMLDNVREDPRFQDLIGRMNLAE